MVAGFPGGGKLTAVPARVRNSIEARGEDIYGGTTVLRDVYALRAEVRPGNSGGPLLAPDGSVYGVVFAASLDEPDTGYALTAEQGMAEMSKKFLDLGAKVYVDTEKVKESNRVL